MDKDKNVINKIVSHSILIFPSILLIAFFMHIASAKDFLDLRFEKTVYDSGILFNELITDGGKNFVHSHAIACLSVPFMVLTILYLGNLLYHKKPVIAFSGIIIGILGSLFMAGFFCAWISFSAISRVEPQNYIGAKAALAELTKMAGVLKIITEMSLLSFIGLIVLCVGLINAKLFPYWSLLLIILGCLVILVFMGLPNWMFIGSMLIFIGLIPVSRYKKQI